MNAQAAGHIHEIRAGERIDGFTVGRLFHEGGMARLYRVTHARYRLPLVMKVPRLGPGAPLAALVAHENEWRILERLHGAHVPKLIAAGELTRAPYLVMEYIEGDRLARAAQQAPRALAEIAALMEPLCRALHELHRQNVIHLDLNPRNVRNRANGEAVLVDFGIAHHAVLPDLIDAAFGEEEGTTPYIAPEQVKHLRSDSRSDVYALGAILYLLATGSYPFGRPNLLSVHKRLFESPRPPRVLRPDLPPWLQEVTLRCLEIRPENRYATARQVGRALSHPEAVHLTRRAHATRPAPWWTRTRLWWRSLYHVFDEGPALTPRERVGTAPHVLVALDLSTSPGAVELALRQVVRRLAAADPHGTFICLAVLAPGSRARHRRTARSVNAQVELRQWAAALRLSPARLHCLALPGQPARVILDYARTHQVDHIVMGARTGSAVRRLLGGVSARVAGEAPCTVTVVRARHDLPSRMRPRPSRRG